MADGRLDRYKIAAQIRARRDVDPTVCDVVTIRRYAGLPDDGGALNYVLNSVLREVDQLTEFDSKWELAKASAKQNWIASNWSNRSATGKGNGDGKNCHLVQGIPVRIVVGSLNGFLQYFQQRILQ